MTSGADVGVSEKAEEEVAQHAGVLRLHAREFSADNTAAFIGTAESSVRRPREHSRRLRLEGESLIIGEVDCFLQRAQ